MGSSAGHWRRRTARGSMVGRRARAEGPTSAGAVRCSGRGGNTHGDWEEARGLVRHRKQSRWLATDLGDGMECSGGGWGGSSGIGLGSKWTRGRLYIYKERREFGSSDRN